MFEKKKCRLFRESSTLPSTGTKLNCTSKQSQLTTFESTATLVEFSGRFIDRRVVDVRKKWPTIERKESIEKRIDCWPSARSTVCASCAKSNDGHFISRRLLTKASRPTQLTRLSDRLRRWTLSFEWIYIGDARLVALSLQ